MSIIYGDFSTGDFIGGYDPSLFKGRKNSLYFFNQRGNSGNYEVSLLVDLLSGLKSSGVNTTGLVGAEAAFTNYSGYFASDLIPSGSLLIDGDLLVSGSIYITGSDGRLVSITGGGGAGGGGAPVNATYLTLSPNATLSNERIFATGRGLSGLDGGANSNYSLSVVPSGAPDATVSSTDYILISDADDGYSTKRVTAQSIGDLGGGGGGGSNQAFSFISDVENNIGLITKTYYDTPSSDVLLSGVTVSEASDLKVYLRWDGPPESYIGVGKINNQIIPESNITELGSYTRRFEGYLDNLNLVGETGITGEANGTTGVISLTELGGGPNPVNVWIDEISNSTPKAGTRQGATALKEDDEIDIFVEFPDNDVTGIRVLGSGISQEKGYQSHPLSSYGSNYLATIPIIISDSGGNQEVAIQAKNNFGTAGPISSSSGTFGPQASGQRLLDQTYPSISASNPTTYNGRTDGLREGESTTFANTISNTGANPYILYSGTNDPDDILIQDSGIYQNPKTVSYVQGIFNNSNNLNIFVAREENGAVDSEDITVKIANGPVITGITLNSTAASATSPNVVGSSEIKGGDVVDAEVYVDGNGVSVGNIDLSISNAGVSDGSQTSYTSYANTTLGDGSFKYTVPIDVSSSIARDGAQSTTMTARNNFGTEGDSVSSSASATVNNTDSPTVSLSSTSYPSQQAALKSSESAGTTNSAAGYDTIEYTSPNGDLSIASPSVFANPKTVSRAGGTYNISTDNLKISATKTSNGKVSEDETVVKIANTALTFSIQNLASTLQSDTGVGNTDNFDLNSNQLMWEIPNLTPDSSQIPACLLTTGASGSGLYDNDYTIYVRDSDQKGTFSWEVSGRNLAGIETTTILTNPDYSISGFEERTIYASATSFGRGLANIGTKVTDPNNLNFENLSEGGSGPNGGTIYTYDSSYSDGDVLGLYDDVDNKFVVCNSVPEAYTTGDHVYNLDLAIRNGNTSTSNPAQFIVSET
jgi:hypothetical protein